MSLAKKLSDIAERKIVEIETGKKARELAERRRLSEAAEDYLVLQTTPKKLEAAAGEGGKFVLASSTGPDYSGYEWNHYSPEFATGRLDAHLEVLKGEGLQVELELDNRGQLSLRIEWEKPDKQETIGEAGEDVD